MKVLESYSGDSAGSGSDTFETLRQAMVAKQLCARGISDEAIVKVMLQVPRHLFIPANLREQAYEDHPVPIGEGQTISQPYIVASMLQALAIRPTDKVLEVGTGSGYVTAILADLAARVFSIERHPALAVQARTTLATLGFDNIEIIVGDGSKGLPEQQPFDVIIVSAAAAEPRAPLLRHLGEKGRMILPVGKAEEQQLQLIHMEDGHPHIALREPCRFVPLVSEHS